MSKIIINVLSVLLQHEQIQFLGKHSFKYNQNIKF